MEKIEIRLNKSMIIIGTALVISAVLLLGTSAYYISKDIAYENRMQQWESESITK